MPKRKSVPRDPPLRHVVPRREPYQERGRTTVTLILDAAQKQIESNGIDRVTTKSIAEEAGLSVGGLYQYFPNKEAIIYALGDKWMSQIREHVERLHPERSRIADAFAYVDQLLHAAREHYENEPGLSAVIESLTVIPELRKLEREHDKLIVESIASGFASLDPGVDKQVWVSMARTFSTMTHAVLNEALIKRGGPAKAMLHYLRVAVYQLVLEVRSSRSADLLQ